MTNLVGAMAYAIGSVMLLIAGVGVLGMMGLVLKNIIKMIIKSMKES